MIKNLFAVKGSWRQRMFIYSMTFLLGLLFVWVLDFILEDIDRIHNPDYTEFEKTYLTKSLVDKRKTLQKEINDDNLQLEQFRQQRKSIRDSAENAQISIKQIDEQQKLLLQYGKTLSDKETKFKSDNLDLFQNNQADEQQITAKIIVLTTSAQKLSNELKQVDESLDKQRVPARKAYDDIVAKQNLMEASIQILFLVIMLAFAGFLLKRYKDTLYRLPLLALFIAVLYEIFIVVHYYFPSEYFKYILIALLIFVVARALMHMISNANSVKKDVLIKRYRDAYAFFLCPGCEFPIRRGPMKYLYWNRRSLPRVILQNFEPNAKVQNDAEECYTCPVCSINLFSTCDSCKKVRYSLLPACPHCGEEVEEK